MKNSELIFLSNELLDEEVRKFIKVPMEFITFAITDGKMYSHYNNNGVFLYKMEEIRIGAIQKYME